MNSHPDAVIQGLYDQLWPLVFAESSGPTKASLEVHISSKHSGYSRERDLICIYLEGWDLENIKDKSVGEFFPEEVGEWESWHRELTEEVAHEYQAKVLAGSSTEEGRRLHRLLWCWCEQLKEHGPDFFTAVAHVARCLQLKPEHVARVITGQMLPGTECPPPPDDAPGAEQT